MRNAVWTVLSLSVSGSAMAQLLFALRPVLAGRVSKRFGYYVWLLVLLRLCLPVSGSVNVLAVVPVPPESGAAALQPLTQTPSGQNTPAVQTEPAPETVPPAGAPEAAVQPETPGAQDAAGQSLFSTVVRLSKDPTVWFWLWGAGALLTCAWYVSGYLRFSAGVRKNGVPAEGEAARILEELCPGRRPELISCACVDTPMLLRLFRPVIVLRIAGMRRNAALESCARAVAITGGAICITSGSPCSFFPCTVYNPVLYFVRRQLGPACELACDEAVVSAMSADERRLYAKRSVAGRRRTAAGGLLATTMCEEKIYLKGRLLGIMHYKKTSAARRGAVSSDRARAVRLRRRFRRNGEALRLPVPPRRRWRLRRSPRRRSRGINTEFFNGDDFKHPQPVHCFPLRETHGLDPTSFSSGRGDGCASATTARSYRPVLRRRDWIRTRTAGVKRSVSPPWTGAHRENMGPTLAGTSAIGLVK
jgi:beta-lactamase regulating signal transducer with metallopeptidase domain